MTTCPLIFEIAPSSLADLVRFLPSAAGLTSFFAILILFAYGVFRMFFPRKKASLLRGIGFCSLALILFAVWFVFFGMQQETCSGPKELTAESILAEEPPLRVQFKKGGLLDVSGSNIVLSCADDECRKVLEISPGGRSARVISTPEERVLLYVCDRETSKEAVFAYSSSTHPCEVPSYPQ